MGKYDSFVLKATCISIVTFLEGILLKNNMEPIFGPFVRKGRFIQMSPKPTLDFNHRLGSFIITPIEIDAFLVFCRLFIIN
jgi:hypothetical protein